MFPDPTGHQFGAAPTLPDRAPTALFHLPNRTDDLTGEHPFLYVVGFIYDDSITGARGIGGYFLGLDKPAGEMTHGDLAAVVARNCRLPAVTPLAISAIAAPAGYHALRLPITPRQPDAYVYHVGWLSGTNWGSTDYFTRTPLASFDDLREMADAIIVNHQLRTGGDEFAILSVTPMSTIR